MSEPAAPLSTAPATRKPSVGSVLIVIGGGILILVVLAALLLPAMTESISRAKITSCRSNLHQLHVMQSTYAIQFGGESKEFPDETGSAFWLKLTRTSPPLLDASEREVLLCPVIEAAGTRPCDYLGPGRPYKLLQKADPVGADCRGNHRSGGGNVVRRSGDLVELRDGDFLSVCDKLSP